MALKDIWTWRLDQIWASIFGMEAGHWKELWGPEASSLLNVDPFLLNSFEIIRQIFDYFEIFNTQVSKISKSKVILHKEFLWLIW